MSKYPFLSIYQTLSIILAVIVVIVGVIAAIGAASLDGDRFQLGTFIITLLPSLITAFGLAVVAELIGLLFDLEDHIAHIRDDLSHLRMTMSKPAEPPNTSASPTYRQAALEATTPTVRIQVTTAALPVRSQPNADAASNSELSLGQTMTVYGRSADSSWLSISRTGKLWIERSGVEVIEGSVSNLSVLEAQ